jgi:hypothetical protein
MGLGITIQLPPANGDRLSDRIVVSEVRARNELRLQQEASDLAQATDGNPPSKETHVYDRYGRAQALKIEPEVDSNEPVGEQNQSTDKKDRPFGVAWHAEQHEQAASTPRFSVVETQLIQSSTALSGPSSQALSTPTVAPPRLQLQAQSLTPQPGPSLTASPSDITSVSSRSTGTINKGSGQAPDLGPKAPVSIPFGATPQDLMRVASSLRRQLLRNPEPTLRDREVASLASKVEARARAMAKADSKRRLEILSSALERPVLQDLENQPQMEHIIRYLDELNDSKPDSMAYYAREKMQDLVLDVEAESTDLRLLEKVNRDLINGVVLDERQVNGVMRDEPRASSFASQVLELRPPYPGESVFVENE